jgi:hypothetical protein
VMVKASSMSSLQPIHHNKMVWYRERTRHSSLLQELCWMTMGFHKGFRRKLSTRHAMLQIECTSTD